MLAVVAGKEIRVYLVKDMFTEGVNKQIFHKIVPNIQFSESYTCGYLHWRKIMENYAMGTS